MKLVFDNIEEVISFLREQGYLVYKNYQDIFPQYTPPYPNIPSYPIYSIITYSSSDRGAVKLPTYFDYSKQVGRENT